MRNKHSIFFFSVLLIPCFFFLSIHWEAEELSRIHVRLLKFHYQIFIVFCFYIYIYIYVYNACYIKVCNACFIIDSSTHHVETTSTCPRCCKQYIVPRRLCVPPTYQCCRQSHRLLVGFSSLAQHFQVSQSQPYQHPCSVSLGYP